MRKCSIILTMVMMLTFGLGSTAFAAEDSTAKVILRVEKSNDRIVQMIQTAVNRASNLQQSKEDIEKLLTDLNNSKKTQDKLEILDEKLSVELDRLIADLIKSTDKTAGIAIKYAYKKGFIVDREYILVDIGGEYVLVDPCRVRSN